ncbi:MAG: hypothetical protein HQL16_06665, partial [Candidatus Omnitrophica bacterium]|nr:hypothetical protein [Candidatus Omnitrophota bacterium]
YPDSEQGRKFWNRVYALAEKKFGTTDIPLDVMNKVWITPGEIVVQERGNVALIAKATLKVMIEDDYLALKASQQSVPADEGKRALMKDVFREVVIPELEKEVNSGADFSRVRQIYHSIILANWYKRRVHDGTLSRSYVDQKKTSGVAVEDASIREAVYSRYLEAYQKGVFNYIREEEDASGAVVPKKYFSGGISFPMDQAQVVPLAADQLSVEGDLVTLDVKGDPAQKPEDYIVANDIGQIGNKGRKLEEMAGILGDHIPPFLKISSNLYYDYRTGKASLEDVVAAVLRQAAPLVENGGTLAIRPASAINMPGILPTKKDVRTFEGVVQAIKAIYETWETPEAQDYLKTDTARAAMAELEAKGLPSRVGPAIIVQKEVFGNKGPESASGVFVSRNPYKGDFLLSGTLGLQTAPEDIRNGDRKALQAISPDMDSEFPSLLPQGGAYAVLEKIADMLERHDRQPVEVEFIIEQGRLYIVQDNKQDLPEVLDAIVNTKMADEGRIPRTSFVVPKTAMVHSVGRLKQGAATKVVIENALGLSPGAVDGVLAFSIEKAKEFHSQGRTVILVSDQFNQPGLLQALVGYRVAQGIEHSVDGLLTLYGDYHMHNARIAREGLVPGVSLKDADANFVEQGGERVLKLGRRIFREGDRLALVAEIKSSGDGRLVHQGAVIVPAQEESVVETKIVPVEDLYFDVAKLQEETKSNYGSKDYVVLTAVHAYLKALLDRNVIRGFEANKLEVATNAIHQICDKTFLQTASSGDNRGTIFTPIADGFEKILLNGSMVSPVDVRSVEDIPKLVRRMEAMVARYKGMTPLVIDYLTANGSDQPNVAIPVGQSLGLGFSIKFSQPVNWNYENPALWAFVRQASARVFYPGEAKNEPGPALEKVTFEPDPFNASQIRVNGSAEVFGRGSKAELTVKLEEPIEGPGGYISRLSIENREWVTVGVENFDDYIRHKAEEVRSFFPLASGASAALSADALKTQLVTYFGMPQYRETLVELEKPVYNGFAPEQEPRDLAPQPGRAFIDGQIVWRFLKQQLGSYESGNEHSLAASNLNWGRESRLFARMIKAAVPNANIIHRAGRYAADHYDMHNARTFWNAKYFSWLTLDEATTAALSAAIARLSGKYDLSPAFRKSSQGEDTLDLESILFLMFLDNGGTAEDLLRMSVTDKAQNVGGIDLDISAQSFGTEGVNESFLKGAFAAEEIKGLVPVIMGQTSIKTFADFIGH